MRRYQIMTNACLAEGSPVWAAPNGPYGNAVCINWRNHGARYTALRWLPTSH